MYNRVKIFLRDAWIIHIYVLFSFLTITFLVTTQNVDLLLDADGYLRERIFSNRYYFINESRRKATLSQFCLALIGIYCYETTRDLTTSFSVFSLHLRFS